MTDAGCIKHGCWYKKEHGFAGCHEDKDSGQCILGYPQEMERRKKRDPAFAMDYGWSDAALFGAPVREPYTMSEAELIIQQEAAHRGNVTVSDFAFHSVGFRDTVQEMRCRPGEEFAIVFDVRTRALRFATGPDRPEDPGEGDIWCHGGITELFYLGQWRFTSEAHVDWEPQDVPVTADPLMVPMFTEHSHVRITGRWHEASLFSANPLR